ncbi:MAG: cell division ATP-binding protein FtsE [Patescibacteria group bacterium]|nr:cell division ATP-binding protein FtsE [Patescibacteria group bacterium]
MIHFKDVVKKYGKKKGEHPAALNGVSFDIKPKEFVSLVGESGAGKSTVVKLINKEIEPSSGEISVGKIDYANFPKRQIPFLRRKIGIVYQDFKLLPKKNVYENVAYALEVAGIRNKDIAGRVPKILKLVGLSDKAKCYPNEISGGEKQRVAIARALVHQPQILIADEPTGNLDPKNAWEIIDLLLKINSFGTTVLLTTHNKDIVDKIKKRVITLKRGKVESDHKVGRYIL